MRRSRVQIGSLVVRHPSLTPADGKALAHTVERSLTQMIRHGGLATDLQSTRVLRMNIPAPAADSSRDGAADAVSQAVYRALKGRS